jgi:ABC-type transport system involved in cytochrome c biogenesis ATPase subunit
MLLKNITYQNKQTGWTLQNLVLDRFNLLVGASGVGKTQILRALRSVQRLAIGRQMAHPVYFSIDFQHANQSYTWEVECSVSGHGFEGATRISNAPPTTITREKLTSSEGGVLVDRDQEKFLFKGAELPQLNRAETALNLLDEDSIVIVRDALINRIIDDHPYHATVPFDDELFELVSHLDTIERVRRVPLENAVLTAFILQERFPEQFARIKSTFTEIFPSVEDVAIERGHARENSSKREPSQRLSFRLKERGIPHWVPAEEISSGMLRSLTHLIELTLAPKDSVVLIDEFENSLGVNCMGPLTDIIQSRASELQFIITSHHPYIINKIPKDHWKIVRRHGGTVTVTPATELRALQGTSAQDDFTRLLNAPEFEEGVS